MTEPDATDQEKPKIKGPDFVASNWYMGTFFSSTLLIPSPLFALLFTPLFPLFIVTFFLPFFVINTAINACKKHHGAAKAPTGFVSKLFGVMLAGAVLGVPIWFAVVKSIIGGRYL